MNIPILQRVTEQMNNPETPKRRKPYKKSTIINESIAKNKVASDNIYVDKATFYQALVERKAEIDKIRATGDLVTLPKISDYVGNCIQKICSNLARKYTFSGYHFRDDMVADAIVHCLRYIDSFDITQSENPFSYFTQAAYYQFLARIESEKQYSYIKAKSMMNSAIYDELSEHGDSSIRNDSNMPQNIEIDMEFYNTFVKDFETKLESKGVASRERRKELPRNKKSLEYAIAID